MADSTKQATLPNEVFAVEVPNHELLKLAYDAYLANSRQSSAKTLKRGEVRGGGKKPWKQKGTGRARVGSSRSPIWRGGGIIFGPSGNENHTKRVAKNSKRVAIKQALTLASQAGKIKLDDIKTTGKTAEVANYLASNQLNRRVLVVVEEKTPEIIRATNNIQNVLLVRSTYLNVYHILNADHIVISPAALPTLTNWLVREEA